jgi:hypothetical protein
VAARHDSGGDCVALGKIQALHHLSLALYATASLLLVKYRGLQIQSSDYILSKKRP